MRRPDLESDCSRCAAICCVATCFSASEDFAIDKASGEPCPHLRSDCRCSIHAERSQRGFAGCTLYECYGAGPRVTRAFVAAGGSAHARDAAFAFARAVHELLWLTTEAGKLCPDERPDLAALLAHQVAALDAHASGPPSEWRASELPRLEASVHALLRRVGAALGGRRQLRVLGLRSDRSRLV